MAKVCRLAGCLMRDEKLQSDHPHMGSLRTRRTVVAAGLAGVRGGRPPC